MNMDYVQGLFMTDGCISKSRYKNVRNDGSIQIGERYEASINQSRDRGRIVLEQVKVVLEKNNIETGIISEEHRGKRQKQYKIRIASKSIQTFLDKRPTIVTKEFVSGVIDGDGSFFIMKRKDRYKDSVYDFNYPYFSLCGNKENKIILFEIVKNFLEKELGIVLKKNYSKKHNLWVYRCNASNDVKRIAEFFKDDCYIRKEKINEILNT